MTECTILIVVFITKRFKTIWHNYTSLAKKIEIFDFLVSYLLFFCDTFIVYMQTFASVFEIMAKNVGHLKKIVCFLDY